MWRFSQSEKRNSAAAEKRGRAKIPGGRPLSNPFPFCPPERKFFRNQRRDFRGKKVRILFRRHSKVDKS